MDYLERINNAVQYMEENIKQDINIDLVAQSVFMSAFHFNRLFHLLVGEPPGTYLRRRRLYEAAMDIDWCMKGDMPESKITFYPEQGTPQPVSIHGQDPYRAECAHILQCVKTGTLSPVIDIEHACQSLKVALAAQESLQKDCEITL
ncbi:MAG: hypothetical protein JW822_03485 [Spirochaetales bacterium]|nr:hypothetical protein [Spirochaetales bacterium]